jgi:hypothetical protein
VIPGNSLSVSAFPDRDLHWRQFPRRRPFPAIHGRPSRVVAPRARRAPVRTCPASAPPRGCALPRPSPHGRRYSATRRGPDPETAPDFLHDRVVSAAGLAGGVEEFDQRDRRIGGAKARGMGADQESRVHGRRGGGDRFGLGLTRRGSGKRRRPRRRQARGRRPRSTECGGSCTAFLSAR